MPVLQHCGVQEYGSHLDPEQVVLLYYSISFTLMKAEVLPPKCPISFLKNLYFEGRVRFNDTTYLLPNITQPLHFRVQCDKYPLQ